MFNMIVFAYKYTVSPNLSDSSDGTSGDKQGQYPIVRVCESHNYEYNNNYGERSRYSIIDIVDTHVTHIHTEANQG